MLNTLQLAIDTSTETASIALVKDSKVLAELTWCCGENHTVELMPNLSYLLSQTGLSLQSVSCVIVATGPGSFNGLRVGVSTAKGLAFALSIPIVGISTLEAQAYQHAETGLPVCAVSNAGRGEIAVGMYQKKRGGWRQLVVEHITTVDMLCSEIRGKTVVCGEYLPALEQIKKHLRQKAVMPTPAALVRRAGFLAELGQQRINAGNYDEPATLQPLYLRHPHITTPKRPY